AARQFPPWPSEPGVGVPEIAGPGTLDAVFNVRDQGAVGDGAADDTGALIRTIGRVPASGGLVYLPHGTYRVTSTIAIARTNVWIFGSGPDATAIRLGDGANADVLAIDAGGCTVSNLTIDGNQVLQASINKSSGFAHGIAIDGNGGVNPNGRHRILGNYVFDACDAGIEVADAVYDVVIEGNTVNGAGVGALAANRYGIYFGG